jgi:hypothetical protein
MREMHNRFLRFVTLHAFFFAWHSFHREGSRAGYQESQQERQTEKLVSTAHHSSFS